MWPPSGQQKQACQPRSTIHCRIILAQLQGSGRGGLGSYNASDYEQLNSLLQTEPLGSDGDAWIEKLMAKNSLLGEGVGSEGSSSR